MLLKFRLLKFALLLLVLIQILHAIPGAFADAGCLDSYSQKPSCIFTTGVVYMGLTFLTVDNRKTAMHSMPEDCYGYLIERNCIYSIPKIKSIYVKVTDDHHNELMRSILHYFHGSKYKYEYFFI